MIVLPNRVFEPSRIRKPNNVFAPNRLGILGVTSDYFDRVENAGGAILAPFAIDAYFRALVDANIWNSLGSSCLFAGVTFEGCFVPIRGDMPVPENNGPFVSGDHDPVTGLKGNGTSKYLDLNFRNDDVPQNDISFGVWITEYDSGSDSVMPMGARSDGVVGSDQLITNLGNVRGVNRAISRGINNDITSHSNAGFFGCSRTSATVNVGRIAQVSTTGPTTTSETPSGNDFYLFARSEASTPNRFTDARLATYFAGLSTTLSTMDTIQTAYVNAVAAELS